MPAVVLWRTAGDRKSNKIALLRFTQQAAECRFATSVKIDGGNVRQVVRPNEWRGQRKLSGEVGRKFPIGDRVVDFDELSVNTRASHTALVRGLMRKENLAKGARKHKNPLHHRCRGEKETTAP
jgi:hypothetical protein